MDTQILTSKELGNIIRDARKAQGLTQDDLAGMTSVGRRFISELEGGKETAQLGKVFATMGALGLALHVNCKWKSS